MEYVIFYTSFALIIIGLWAVITRRNIFRIIIGFTIFDTGINTLIVALGYLKGGTAPIMNKAVAGVTNFVDPLPQALVLTSIVIGLGVTALMLVYAVKLYGKKKILEIDKFEGMKW